MQQKIKILHLEDAPSDADLIAWELKKANINAEILVVDSKAEFINELHHFTYDIILSDHSLASFNSHEALRLVKEAGVTVPFILVTATMADEFAASVMKEGACDYILKDRLNRLPSAVISSIEKHRVDEEHHASLDRLLFHIENTPLGFIEWDSNGFAKTWSRRAEEIFGWSEEEFINSQVKRFNEIFPEDLSWVSKVHEQLITGAVERNKLRHRNITKDGRVIWCEWFNSVLKDKGGNVKTIMSLVQDITEQKQLEWQKDNFLAMLSHELKTPVTTIKAYGQIAETMLEVNGDAHTLGIVKKLGTQVNKLTTLIETFLDFTKLQDGKLIYNEVVFDFDELVKEVINDMQKISPTHEIKIDPGKAGFILGDKDKLSQVLNNLISNAIKYSPGAGSIIISTKVHKNSIELSVEDFGIGILEQEQQHVFEQFYRVNGAKSTFSGMGIGLYICSEIISRHGGKIWVKSLINKGSTFCFRIPLNHRNKAIPASI